MTQVEDQDRVAFAEGLKEYNDQRSWYSKRSGENKTLAQRLDLFVIACGALIAAVPIFKPGGAAHWSEILVSFLGAAVVVGQGVARVFRYSDTWPEYRLASERMKREKRLFIYGSPPYAADLQAAQELYKERLERIIAEEQKIFFEGQQKQETNKGD